MTSYSYPASLCPHLHVVPRPPEQRQSQVAQTDSGVARVPLLPHWTATAASQLVQLKLEHVRPQAGDEERLGRLQSLAFVSARQEELGRALNHLLLDGDFLFEVFFEGARVVAYRGVLYPHTLALPRRRLKVAEVHLGLGGFLGRLSLEAAPQHRWQTPFRCRNGRKEQILSQGLLTSHTLSPRF